MSTATRIDELRKKFEENPRRYFAPLANEYRKAGDLAQAIALCREHLPKQPGHMSGYIVFGQALFESGELTEARDVFEQAIDLDPENLIALRHLGDIAQASGDVAGARRWWGRVYDADPRNDDIAAQLATLSTRVTPQSVPVVPSFDALARMPETPAVPMTAIGFGVAPTPDAVMRAIDMDAVNARMQHHTPIDLDAHDAAVVEIAAANDEIEQASTTETEHVAGPRVDATPVDVEGIAALDASEPMDNDDVFDFPEETSTGEVAASGEATEQSDDQSDDAFEEGLVAAEWPDTSELVARVLTPRSVTPRSVTPRFSATYEETVSAFGREAGESEVPVAEVVHEVAAISAAETADDADDAVSEPLARLESDLTAADADESTTQEYELPWLAMPAPGTEATPEEIENAEPGLEAIAEAFAEDARSAGDDSPMTVAALDDGVPDGESESFADVAQELLEDEYGDATDAIHADAPAFVTETMGELLVSQGFVARAIDVYSELVRRRPYDAVLTSRLDELRGVLAASAQPDAVPAVDASQHVNESFSTELEATFATESASEFADEFAEPFTSDANEAARPTPSYGTPSYASPAFVASQATPHATQRATPYAQPSIADELPTSRTAREWFAAIAARRVPRRTPSQANPLIAEDSPEGLAALFGHDPSAQDDVAAQALADAFAPVTAQDLASGSALDLDFDRHRATPSFSPSLTPARAASLTPVTGPSGFTHSRGPTITPVTGSNAGFSFDRFFPDPAMRRVTPAPSSPVVPDAPVTDDLAQFSAWLKGLGTS